MTGRDERAGRRWRVAFLGAPASGKGTQAAALAAELGVPHVSTGDATRAAASEDTPEGRALAARLAAGQLAPDDVVVDAVRRRLAEPDAARGFVLDGFPRTAAQAAALDATPGCAGALAVLVDVPDAVALARAAGRSRGPDDAAAVAVARVAAFRRELGPLRAWYEARGMLEVVDGVGPVGDVASRVRAAVRPPVDLPETDDPPGVWECENCGGRALDCAGPGWGLWIDGSGWHACHRGGARALRWWPVTQCPLTWDRHGERNNRAILANWGNDHNATIDAHRAAVDPEGRCACEVWP